MSKKAAAIPLPQPDVDPIIRLYDYYFTQSDILYREFEKLWIQLEAKGRLNDAKVSRLQRFAQLWLATLFVVTEGFQSPIVSKFYQECPDKDLGPVSACP